jgi:hypothetical protein
MELPSSTTGLSGQNSAMKSSTCAARAAVRGSAFTTCARHDTAHASMPSGAAEPRGPRYCAADLPFTDRQGTTTGRPKGGAGTWSLHSSMLYCSGGFSLPPNPSRSTAYTCAGGGAPPAVSCSPAGDDWNQEKPTTIIMLLQQTGPCVAKVLPSPGKDKMACGIVVCWRIYTMTGGEGGARCTCLGWSDVGTAGVQAVMLLYAWCAWLCAVSAADLWPPILPQPSITSPFAGGSHPVPEVCHGGHISTHLASRVQQGVHQQPSLDRCTCTCADAGAALPGQAS